MICTQCQSHNHEECVDEVHHRSWVDYVKSDLAEPTKNQHHLMKVTRPYKSCNCQHVVSVATVGDHERSGSGPVVVQRGDGAPG